MDKEEEKLFHLLKKDKENINDDEKAFILKFLSEEEYANIGILQHFLNENKKIEQISPNKNIKQHLKNIVALKKTENKNKNINSTLFVSISAAAIVLFVCVLFIKKFYRSDQQKKTFIIEHKKVVLKKSVIKENKITIRSKKTLSNHLLDKKTIIVKENVSIKKNIKPFLINEKSTLDSALGSEIDIEEFISPGFYANLSESDDVSIALLSLGKESSEDN